MSQAGELAGALDARRVAESAMADASRALLLAEAETTELAELRGQVAELGGLEQRGGELERRAGVLEGERDALRAELAAVLADRADVVTVLARRDRELADLLAHVSRLQADLASARATTLTARVIARARRLR